MMHEFKFGFLKAIISGRATKVRFAQDILERKGVHGTSVPLFGLTRI